MFHWQEKIFSQGGKGTLTWNSNIGKKKKKEKGSFENMYTQQTHFNRCSVFVFEK